MHVKFMFIKYCWEWHKKKWVPLELRLPVKRIKIIKAIFIQGIKVMPKPSVSLAGGLRVGSVCDSIWTIINLSIYLSTCLGFLDPTPCWMDHSTESSDPVCVNRSSGQLYCAEESFFVLSRSKGTFWKRLARHTRPVSRSNELWRRLDAPVLNMQLNVAERSCLVHLNPINLNTSEDSLKFIESMKCFWR